MRGRVKWFDRKKGYGFIVPERNGKVATQDVFVHYKSILTNDEYKSLPDGAEVEFDVEQTRKGLSAKDVRVVESAT